MGNDNERREPPFKASNGALQAIVDTGGGSFNGHVAAELIDARKRINDLEAKLAVADDEWQRINYAHQKEIREHAIVRSAFIAERTRSEALEALLREALPLAEAMVCYASTVAEHPLNNWEARVRAALAKGGSEHG